MSGSIGAVINSGFVSRFLGARGASSSNSSTQSSSSANDQVSLTSNVSLEGLKAAYTNLGDAASFVNLSVDTLEKLDGILKKVVSIAEVAAQGSTSNATRQRLTKEYEKLGKEFAKVLSKAKIGNLDLLSVDDLKAVLNSVGLEPEKTEALARAFSAFILPKGQRSLASDAVKETAPLRRVASSKQEVVVETVATPNSQVVDLQIGDVTSDGIADIVSVTNSLQVQVGNGDGTYKAATSQSGSGLSGVNLTLKDLNNDDKLDVITAGGANSSKLFWFLGNGNGTFQSMRSMDVSGVDTSSGIYDFQVGDFTGDGKADISVVDPRGDGRLITLVGSGDGTFSSTLSKAMGLQSASVTTTTTSSGIGYFDGDSKVDVVTGLSSTAATSAGISVSLGNAAGATPQSISDASLASVVTLSATISSTALADFNRDGIDDMLSLNSANQAVTIRLGVGDGTFQTGVSFQAAGGTSTGTKRATIGDFNNDGKLDVASSEGSGYLNVYLGNGNGTLQAAQSIATTLSSTYGINSADLNNDGSLDMVTADLASSRANVFFGNGNGTFRQVISFATQSISNGVISLADLNGDNRLDFIQGSPSGSSIGVNFGNGTYTYGSNPLDPFTGADNTFTGDINGDSVSDLIVANTEENTVTVFVSNGNGTYRTGVSFATGSGPSSVVLGKFNADSYVDIVTINSGSNGASILLGNNNGTFGSSTTFAAGSVFGTMSAVYADGDTNLDLISRSGVFLGNGNGTFAALSGSTPFSGFAGGDEVFTGDFNEDGVSDAVVTNTEESRVSILLGNANGTYQTSVSYAVGTSPSDVAVADFTGDGVDDIVTADGSGGTVSLLVGKGRGNATFKSPVGYSVDPGPRGPVVADFNGDGTVDLLSISGTNGTVGFLKGNGNGTFAAQVTSLVGGSSALDDVSAADFNGDGKLDLVVNAFGTNSINVLLGNGNGTFYTQVTFGGSVPYAVIAAKVDSDSYYDIVSVDYGTKKLSVRLGNGNGTFQSVWTVDTGFTPRQVVAGDLNKDGTTDLVVTDAQNNNALVYSGKGNGTFYSAVTYSVGANPRDVVLTDLTGDNYLDIVTMDTDDNVVSVLVGNTDGSFKARVSYAVGTMPWNLTTADYNGDGFADLITNEIGINSGSVLLGNGNGTFKSRQTMWLGENGYGLTSADFNSDGVYDLATADLDTSKISVYLGNAGSIGSGAFNAGVSFAAGTAPQTVTAADFNGDSKLDVVAVDSSTASARILLGNGNGTFQASTSFGAGAFKGEVSAVDADGNGTVDLVTTGGIFFGNGNGTFATGSTNPFNDGASFAVGANSAAAVAGDVNRDGKLDLISSSSAESAIRIRLGNGNGTFSAAYSVATASAGGALALGDLNGDGITDIASGATGTGNSSSVLYGNGNGTFRGALSLANQNNNSLALGDLNRDGAVDVISANYSASSASVFLGNSGQSQNTSLITVSDFDLDGSIDDVATLVSSYGGLETATTLQSTTTTSRTETAAGDFNGDGIADLASADYSTNKVSVFIGNGDGTYATGQTIATGNNPNAIFSADIDGDGALDLLTADGADATVSVLRGNGNGTFRSRTGALTLSVGAGTTGVLAADLNKDGKIDIASAEADGSTLSILFNNGNGTFASRLSVSVGNARSIASGDVDRDGNVDLISGDYAEGKVSVVLGNGNGTFKARVSYDSGALTYKARVADVNNDGALDIYTANAGGTANVLLGNGNGTFGARKSFVTGQSTRDVLAVDVTKDGVLDLVSADYSPAAGVTALDGSALASTVSVFAGNGNGTFGSRLTVAGFATSRVSGLTAADVDRDGALDILASSENDGTVSVLLNQQTSSSHVVVQLGNGNGTFAVSTSFATSYAYDMGSADVTGDGVADVVLNTASSTVVYEGKGNGTFRGAAAGESVGLPGRALALGDVNNDGVSDVLTSSSTGGGVGTYSVRTLRSIGSDAQTGDYDNVFAAGRKLISRADALALAADAKKMRKNIQKNLKAMSQSRDAIVNNMRAVALTSQAVSEAVKQSAFFGQSNPETVANRVKESIQSDGTKAIVDEIPNLYRILAALQGGS